MVTEAARPAEMHPLKAVASGRIRGMQIVGKAEIRSIGIPVRRVGIRKAVMEVSHAEMKSSRRILKKRASRAVAALLLAAAFSACSSGGAFDSDFKPVKVWHKSRPLVFELPDTASVAGSYDIALSVRHGNYYPYTNLWLLADFISGGRVAESDTVNVVLADKFGNWTGSGLGKLYQTSVLLKRSVPVGRYERVVLWHYMRGDSVPNLSDIGLTYIKSE